MGQILNISVCQADVLWESPVENMRRFRNFILRHIRECGEHSRPDLTVLPEFFTTGFTSNVDFAEPVCGPAMDWMLRLASETGSAIAGSVPVEQNGGVYNRMYFATPEGVVHIYDKRHLFRMSGENYVFSAGAERMIVRYRDWRIGLNICYDLRFPVWSRNVGNAYDVMLNVASWPSSRIEAASILAHARAVENQAWFVFCNRVGSSPENTYNGGSLVVDFKGRSTGTVRKYEDMGENGCFIDASLDMMALIRFREKFPAWMDADKFTLLNDVL